MTILITGANGQVGNELKKKFHFNKLDILALDRKLLDISSKLDVKKSFQRYRPKLVINTAAYTNVNKAEIEKNSAFLVNETGTMNLAQSCKDFKIPMIHLSTDYVFNGKLDRPYLEVDPTGPLNIYGESKEAGENILRSTLSQHIIIRTSWVFSKNGNNFVKTMLKLGRNNNKISVISNQIGGPTSAASIAQCLFLIIKKLEKEKNLPWGTYHFSQLPYCSWYEFAKKIFYKASKIYNYPSVKVIPVSSEDFSSLVKRPENSRLDSKKIKSIINLKSQSNWENDLTDIINEIQ